MLDADREDSRGRQKMFARKGVLGEFDGVAVIEDCHRQRNHAGVRLPFSLSRRTATSTATGRLPRTGSLNVSVSWRIAHLLAVKYAMVTQAREKAKPVMAISTFHVVVLGAATPRAYVPTGTLRSRMHLICHAGVTGRVKFCEVNRLIVVRRTLKLCRCTNEGPPPGLLLGRL